MKTISASEFKAKCLRVMDEVERSRIPVVVTKNGRPVVTVLPAEPRTKSIFGCMAGTAKSVGDLVEPAVPPSHWKALK